MYRCLLIILLFSHVCSANNAIQFVFTYEGKRFEKIIDDFSQAEGIPVERLWAEQGDLRVKLVEYVERGNAPDVVLIPSDHVGLYRLMNYSTIPVSLQSSKVSDELWLSATSDGTTYGVPIIQGNHLMLYFNKKYVKNPAKSINALMAEKKQFLSQSTNPDVKFMAWNYGDMYWLAAFLGAYGGLPVVNSQVTLNTPAMIKALKSYKEIADLQLIEKNCDYDCANEAFKKQELAYVINGDWAFKEYKELLGDDLGITILPVLDNSLPLVSLYTTHSLAFPNNSLQGSKKESLEKLVRYMLSEKVQREIWQQMGALPVHSKVFAEVSQSDSSHIQGILKALAASNTMPSDSPMSIAWSAMRKGFLRYQVGVLNAEQTARLMQTIADQQVRRHLN